MLFLSLKKDIRTCVGKNEEIRGWQIMGMKNVVLAVFCLMLVLISTFSPINGERSNILFLSGIRTRGRDEIWEEEKR